MATHDVEHECVGLLVDASADVAPSRPRRLGRGLAGCAVAALGLAGAACMRKAWTPCAARAATTGSSIVSLVEASGGGLLHAGAAARDPDLVARWLSDAIAAGEAAADTAAAEKARAELRQALAANATEARMLVERALGKAAEKWHGSRKDLLKFVTASDRELYHLRKRTSAEEATVASCTFNALQATTQLAALATGINDAAKTCDDAGAGPPGSPVGPGKICALNVQQIVASIASIAASLSLAAANCAQTLVPHTKTNLDALCSGTITGLIQSLMEFSIGAELTSTACTDKIFTEIPQGTTPANIGSGRRLMFGGGMDSASTFCAVDVSSAAWYLAQAGISINAAANPQAGATCPPKHAWGGGFVKGRAFAQGQGFCSVNVAGAIYGFLQAIKYVKMAFVHCTDTWNEVAVCSAGIDGMLASADGIAYAGSAMWLTCDELKNAKKPLPPPTLNSLKNNALGNSGNFGRRLAADEDRNAADFQKRFGTPEGAWRSMGYDVVSEHTALREVQPRRPSVESVVELLQQPTSSVEAADAEYLCS